MGDSVSDVILIVTEHILRRYALPLTLLTGQLAQSMRMPIVLLLYTLYFFS